MDIDLLSRMVGELILEHDQVGLPGVGTFVAEMVPATFSDKGYTIHPPYRRLSFYPSRLEDSLLIKFYAEANQITREASAAYITQYLAELKSVLEERKTIVLPGLGRLRATRENTLFFVPDEGLDIYPAGVGLEPVSLKSLEPEEQEPVVIDVPLPGAETVEPVEEEAPETVGTEEGDSPVDPANDGEEASEQTEEAEPESEEEEPKSRPATYPAAWIHDDWKEPERKGLPVWIILLIILISVAIVALVAFMVLARVAPDFIDTLLYTPDELRIINY
ncbi:MAG: hypothetical protein SPK76_04770 [Bacteroidales bacterium]|nr:hypothetical protein [Bacteroidales bacterium]MDY6444327.1 hypothetical protein [Bacteroidales bacterium]